MHSFSHSLVPINAMQDMVVHLVCHLFSHSFIDIRQKLSLIHLVIHTFTHYVPAVLKWFTALYVMMTLVFSITLSCQILYS